MTRWLVIATMMALGFSACGRQQQPPPHRTTNPESGPEGYALRAQCFRVDTLPGMQLLTVFQTIGNRSQQRYLLMDSASTVDSIPDSLLAVPRLHIPARRIALMSTTYIPYFLELGAMDRIVAVADTTWIWGERSLSLLRDHPLAVVGNPPELDMERLLTSTPDLVIAFGSGDARYDAWPQLIRARLPALLTSEWMEPTPLGRTEWVRLFGILLGMEHKGDSLFAIRLAAYDSLHQILSHLPDTPRVLTGYPEGDSWLLSSGGGYFARLLSDAGSRHLFADSAGHVPTTLPFETILTTTQATRSYWLQPGIWNSRIEGESSDPRVQFLEPWKSHRVFQSNLRLTSRGASDYWQSAMYYCDSLLADIGFVLHPDALPGHKPVWFQALPAEAL